MSIKGFEIIKYFSEYKVKIFILWNNRQLKYSHAVNWNKKLIKSFC